MTYVCRWCGEASEVLQAEDLNAHRLCNSALAVQQSDIDSPEDMLLVAEQRELSRPSVVG